MCKSAHQSFSHRVKSVTMSTWTLKEVRALSEKHGGGNKACIAKWLSSGDVEKYRPHPGDSLDKYKNFIRLAYEEKMFMAKPDEGEAAEEPAEEPVEEKPKEEEEDIKSDDRKFILDVLNYGMRDIFAAFGMNTSAGEFVYVDKTLPDPTKQADVIMKAKAMGLPVSDDYMYEVLGIDKPDNYDEMKAEMLAEKERMEKLQTDGTGDDGDRDDRSGKKSLKDRLKGFFVFAPKGDGALPF